MIALLIHLAAPGLVVNNAMKGSVDCSRTGGKITLVLWPRFTFSLSDSGVEGAASGKTNDPGPRCDGDTLDEVPTKQVTLPLLQAAPR